MVNEDFDVVVAVVKFWWLMEGNPNLGLSERTKSFSDVDHFTSGIFYNGKLEQQRLFSSSAEFEGALEVWSTSMLLLRDEAQTHNTKMFATLPITGGLKMKTKSRG